MEVYLPFATISIAVDFSDPVISRILTHADQKGALHGPQPSVQFTISTLPSIRQGEGIESTAGAMERLNSPQPSVGSAGDTTTAGRLMTEAVNQAMDVVDQMSNAPSVLGRSKDAVNNINTVIGQIATVTGPLEPLLEKLQLFMVIMDGIAEVFDSAECPSIFLTMGSHVSRFIHMPRWRAASSLPSQRYVLVCDICLSAALTGGTDATQALLAQIHCDESIHGLVDTIVNVYQFVLNADSLKYARSGDQSPSQKNIIEILAAMAAQTIECAYFIRAYADKKSFCKQVFRVTSIRPDNVVRAEDCEASHL